MILAYLTMKAICERRKDVQHYFHGGNNMNKRIVKKVVSVIACASILAGYASICNAYSIDNNYTALVATHDISKGKHDYGCYTSYIHYDGLAVGSFIPGLRLRANKGGDSDLVCEVTSSYKSGKYTITTGGSHQYKLHNNSGKHVSITFSINYYY